MGTRAPAGIAPLARAVGEAATGDTGQRDEDLAVTSIRLERQYQVAYDDVTAGELALARGQPYGRVGDDAALRHEPPELELGRVEVQRRAHPLVEALDGVGTEADLDLGGVHIAVVARRWRGLTPSPRVGAISVTVLCKDRRMALYQDPAKPRLRPSLVKDLFTIPAKATNHQIENQATAVLAWLIDRSPALAAAIVELFLGDAAPRVTHAGTRTWVSLPKPGGGAVFPDLSIDGDGASLQLLIEVKVGSDFHDYVTPEGTVVSQPEFYRRVWSRLPTWGEARQRAVGTLTRHGGPMPVELAALRARDVTWSQVRDRLRALLEAGELATDVALVAASFLEAIDAQIAVEAPDPSHLKAWLAQHRPVVDAIGDELTSLLPGASAASSSGGQFVARRVTIPEVLGRALVLRVYASPAGSGLTLPGWPDGVIVGVERDANGTLEAEAALRFAEVGFLRRRDIDGFWLHRELWPMEQARQDPAATAAQVVELVAATGLVSLR